MPDDPSTDRPADTSARSSKRLVTASLSSLAVVLLLLFVVYLSAATDLLGVCVPSSYSVTATATPATGNWTDTAGVWTPSGGFPGCAPGDSAADTNASPTTLIVNSVIPNPIVGLLLACNGCVIDVQSGGQLTLAGVANIGSGATLQISGGTLTIQGTASLALASGSQLVLSGGTVDGAGTINNGGSVQMTGASLMTVSAVLNNLPGGSVSVNSGILELASGGSGDAPFTIGSGAILRFPSGSYVMTPNGVVSGGGTLAVIGGTLSIGGVTSPNGFMMSAGTLTGAGFMTVNSLSWSGGTMTGTGGTQLAGSGLGTISGVDGAMLLDGRNFDDYGTINYTATTNALSLANGAVLSVFGTFDIQADGSINCTCGAPLPAVHVAPNGELFKSGGTSTSTIAPPFTNDATVVVVSGTLLIAGSGIDTGAFFAISPGTIDFAAPSTTLAPASFVSGNGTVAFSAGASDLAGTYSVSGTTSLSGGAFVTVDSPASTFGFIFDSGSMSLNAGFDMSGPGTWSGGSMNGIGIFTVDSGATLTIDAAVSTTAMNGNELDNNGTINYTAAAIPGNHLQLNGTALLVNNGLFDIQSDQPIVEGVIIVGATKPAPLQVPGGRPARRRTTRLSARTNVIVAGSEIDNNGTFQKSAAGGTNLIDPALVNAGTVLALSGTMDFTSSYTQTAGTTTLGPGSITVATPLALNGGVLDGAGTLTGDLQNNALVSPATPSTTGVINVTGNYTQGAGGALTIKLAGAAAGQFDQLTVGIAATLAGTFNAVLLSSYAPPNATTWPAMTFASSSLAFATQNLPTYPLHGSIQSSLTPTAFNLFAVVIPPSADLAAAVTGPPSINAGAPLSYNVTISSLGPDTTSGTISVADTLPAGATAASGSGSGWSCGAPSGGVITCTTTAALANGGSLPVLTISMTAPPNGGSVQNTATVTSPIADPSLPDNTSAATTTVVAQADVSITKSGPAGVNAGQNIVYTITVTNNGPSQATGVTVTDPTPASLTFVSNTGACTSAFPCNLGTLNAGQSATIISTYSTPGTFAGNVTNTATVSSTTADPSSANNIASATTNVGAQADLSIIKSGPASTTAGQNAVYTLTISNAGPSPALNTVVSDVTPVGLAFQSNSGACASTFPCNLGTLNAGQSATITSTYSVPGNYAATSIVNTATISSTVNDPNPSDNSSTATTTVAQQADISILKSAPTTVSAGQNITYTLTILNGGPSPAASVVVSDPTPAGLTFVSNSGGCATAFPCSLGTLNVGQTSTITAVFNVPAGYAGTLITNTATVATAATDPNSSNNSSTASATVVAAADLSITKSGPASIQKGQNIAYTITVTNAGTIAAANVFVADPTPSGLTFVSNSGACATAFPCGLGSLTSGQSATITSTYNVPASFAGTSITNTATVSSSTPDANPSNNTAAAVTTVGTSGSTANLAIFKSGPPQAQPNAPVDFTLTVVNDGPSTATNVVVADPTPAGLTALGNSGACSTPFPCSLGSLAPGQSVTITAIYTVNAQAGTIVTNSATVSSSVTDPNPADNTATVQTTICSSQAPQILSPAPGAVVGSTVSFSWTAVPLADSYFLTINGSGTPVTISTTATTATATLPTGSYSWSVKAIGNALCGGLTSAGGSFGVCKAPVAPLASVIGETTTGQTYAVQWAAVDGASGYQVEESTDVSFANPTVANVNDTSKLFTKSVNTATAFFYRVRAVSSCNQTAGAYSPIISVVVVPIPAPDTPHMNLDLPYGTAQPVTFQVFVPGLPAGTTTFVATVDRPWLTVLPVSGVIPPEGITLTVSADPGGLANGTWTGTILIVYGNTALGKSESEATTAKSIPVSISLVTPVTPVPQSHPAAGAAMVPLVAHLAATTSDWQSDVRIANLSSQAQQVQLSLSDGSGNASLAKQTTITIAPGATTALDDIVRNWYGVGSLGSGGNGFLQVLPLSGSSTSPSVSATTVSSTRTYNLAAAGTLGQFIPAIPFSSFIGAAVAGSRQPVLSLQQIAQSATYRTNVGLVEAAGASASLTLSIFNAAGNKLTEVPVNLAPFEQKQLNSLLLAQGIALDDGRIQVAVNNGSGMITAYASVLDNRTNDPLFVAGVPLGQTLTNRYVIPGVSHLDNGVANWRTDMRVFNGDTSVQTTTLSFYPMGGGSPSTASITINPGEVRTLNDIVQTQFGATNAGGTVHVTTPTDSSLIVSARTYNQTAVGTLGQFVPAVTAADAVGLNDRSLQILQVEDSAHYRTNLGLAEISGQPATAEITVILPDSKVAPRVQLTLAPFESRQFPILSSLGLGATYNARISVRVTSGAGKIAAYGSVIDMTTQAPTYIPAQ